MAGENVFDNCIVLSTARDARSRKSLAPRAERRLGPVGTCADVGDFHASSGDISCKTLFVIIITS
jgi:hypothetical protein